MKYLFSSFLLVFSSLAMSSSVATPYVPCFVNGEYMGTIEISRCDAHDGTMTKKPHKHKM